MVDFTLPPRQWAEEQFGACQLGDSRRTRRAIEVAAAFAANPSGSTPHQTEDWADLKAAYRLFDSDGVTWEMIDVMIGFLRWVIAVTSRIEL